MKTPKRKIYYNKKTDVLWFMIKSGPEEEYKEIAPGVNVELGKNGEILGIEILDASKVLGAKLNPRTNFSPAITHKIRN